MYDYMEFIGTSSRPVGFKIKTLSPKGDGQLEGHGSRQGQNRRKNFTDGLIVIALHLVMTFTVRHGKIHPFLRTVNHRTKWAIYTMAMLVITRG